MVSLGNAWKKWATEVLDNFQSFLEGRFLIQGTSVLIFRLWPMGFCKGSIMCPMLFNNFLILLQEIIQRVGGKLSLVYSLYS